MKFYENEMVENFTSCIDSAKPNKIFNLHAAATHITKVEFRIQFSFVRYFDIKNANDD